MDTIRVCGIVGSPNWAGNVDRLVSQVLLGAFEAHPERFIKGNVPSVPQPPAMVWINPPETEADTKIRH